MPRPTEPRHFFVGSPAKSTIFHASIAAKTRLLAPRAPQQRLVGAVQRARERQNAARVSRVVRKMAQTIESI